MSEVRLPAPVEATVDPLFLQQEWEAAHRFVPGSFAIPDAGKSLWFACRCGCNDVRHLPLGEGGWAWDGNRAQPTLAPSIFMYVGPDGRDPHWHGFLRAGMWVQA